MSHVFNHTVFQVCEAFYNRLCRVGEGFILSFKISNFKRTMQNMFLAKTEGISFYYIDHSF